LDNPGWPVSASAGRGLSVSTPTKGDQKPELSAVCPTTGKRISTGILTDSTTLAMVWFSDVRVKCPHCGKKHAIKIREAYVESALSNERLHGVHAA
jgi:hypothetical protein